MEVLAGKIVVIRREMGRFRSCFGNSWVLIRVGIC